MQVLLQTTWVLVIRRRSSEAVSIFRGSKIFAMQLVRSNKNYNDTKICGLAYYMLFYTTSTTLDELNSLERWVVFIVEKTSNVIYNLNLLIVWVLLFLYLIKSYFH